MQTVVRWLGMFIPVSEGSLKKIVVSAIVLLVMFLIRTLIVRGLLRRIGDIRTRYLWRKITTYVISFAGLIVIGSVWFKGIHELATIIGFLSAGIAIALRDVFTNFAGWLFIIWARPFRVSDRIQIGDYAGDVIDIGLFQTSLMEIGNWVDADQSTGRVIRMPNEFVFSRAMSNYSQGFQYIWNEIPVLVTFESDWREAKRILIGIAKRHTEHLSAKAEKQVREASRHFMIFFSKLTPKVYTTVKDSGVLLTIRYLCEPRQRRGSAEKIWEDILQEFAEKDTIDFAYPTQRFYRLSENRKADIQPIDDDPFDSAGDNQY